MEYTPEDASKITDTVMLVGKGVTYDTGGADVKYGGSMPGMSRDKSGGAAVIGFMKVDILFFIGWLHNISYNKLYYLFIYPVGRFSKTKASEGNSWCSTCS